MESATVEVVKQGFVKKKAEHLKDWRSRYFILKTNGEFLGYRREPSTEAELKNRILNNFTVKNCQIIVTDHGPRKFTFAIRGLHLTTVVERTFHAESEEDRQSWVRAIEAVKKKIDEETTGLEVTEATDPDHPFSERGHTISKKGKSKITFENFEFLKLIGQGSYGKVILCREKATSHLYAIKVLEKDKIVEDNEVAHTMTEVKVLQKANHPFIMSLKYSFTTANRLCLVTEFVNGGDLYFHLSRENGPFPEERARFYGAEIVSAIGYLHRNRIMYRDLKLEHILLDKEGHIKLADFGLCKEASSGKTNTYCGTPEYIPPEMILDNDNNEYGQAVDWWSFGVVMYEMMIGMLPFDNSNLQKMYDDILNSQVEFPRFPGISSEAQDLLLGLLTKDPDQRLGGGPKDAQDVQVHDFFKHMDWIACDNRQLTPPVKPQVTSDVDTSNFDIEFTGESVALTPDNAGADDLRSQFSGYTYSAASAASNQSSGRKLIALRS